MKYTHEQWTCQSQLDTAARGVSLSLQPSWGGGGLSVFYCRSRASQVQHHVTHLVLLGLFKYLGQIRAAADKSQY